MDVTLVSGLVRNAILCIEDDFIDERCIDINATQVGIGGFPIIPDYGPEKGYLYGLRSALHGDMLFAEKLVRDIDGSDLIWALQFQISFSKAICHNLEKMFVDNSILSCIKILVPSQHPTQVRLLKEYGISECQRIADFYGIEKVVGNENFAALINADQFKRQFRIFKRQVADEWARMTLVETTNAFLKLHLFNVVAQLHVNVDLVSAQESRRNGGIEWK